MRFPPSAPLLPPLIAFVHLYTVHHHLRQRSSGGRDCLVFVGVVKYIVIPAVFLMFMQRQHQTKQQNPCRACGVAEFSLPAFLPVSSCCRSEARFHAALLYTPTCVRTCHNNVRSYTQFTSVSRRPLFNLSYHLILVLLFLFFDLYTLC